MGDRYIISGTQIGMLKAYLGILKEKNKENIEYKHLTKLINNIILRQHLFHSEKFLDDDILKIRKFFKMKKYKSKEDNI